MSLTAWLNQTLHLGYTVLEWDSIFAHCPVTNPCCTQLDSLITLQPCDSVPLFVWLNQHTGWNWTDSSYLTQLHNCHLDSTWMYHCVSCDSLQAVVHAYPCGGSLSLTAWLNQTLHLGYTTLEWNTIFAHCPVTNPCCTQLDSLITLQPCDSVPLFVWLNQHTGWNWTDSSYLSQLHNCH